MAKRPRSKPGRRTKDSLVRAELYGPWAGFQKQSCIETAGDGQPHKVVGYFELSFLGSSSQTSREYAAAERISSHHG